MKLIIAGSRTLDVSEDQIIRYLHECNIPTLTEVISGTAKGIDKSGEFFAEAYEITLAKFPADWNKYGKGAGHIRNKQMADYADALLLIWDGESKGSANMKKTMEKLNKPVYEVIIRSNNEI